MHGDFVVGSDHVSDVMNMKQKPLDSYLTKKGEVCCLSSICLVMVMFVCVCLARIPLLCADIAHMRGSLKAFLTLTGHRARGCMQRLTMDRFAWWRVTRSAPCTRGWGVFVYLSIFGSWRRVFRVVILFFPAWRRVSLMPQEIYRSVKREPLGKSFVRGHALPTEVKDPTFAFGISSSASEAAKNLLFPVDSVDSEEARDLYKRSHAGGLSDHVDAAVAAVCCC